MLRRFGTHVRQNVIAYLALFVALGGTSYAAATIGSAQVVDNSLQSQDLKDNAAVRSRDVVDDNVTGGGLRGNDIVETSLGKVPNADKLDGLDSTAFQRAGAKAPDADKLDGKDSTAFGQVRDFHADIAAASAGDRRDLVSFGGLTLWRNSSISGGQLRCQLGFDASPVGWMDVSEIAKINGVGSTPNFFHTTTPTQNFSIHITDGGGSADGGQLVFHNRDNGRTLTVAYSVVTLGSSSDINSQGCAWQGTVTATG
jgi:hypothetical protein